jgi:hypothetical protein
MKSLCFIMFRYVSLHFVLFCYVFITLCDVSLHFVLFRSISFSLLMLRIWVIYSDYNIIAIIAIILISGQVRWATSAAKYTLSHTLHYLEAQESTILRHSWRQAVLDLGKVTDGTAKK